MQTELDSPGPVATGFSENRSSPASRSLSATKCLKKYGLDLAGDGWDLAESGWDLAEDGWDLAEWFERLIANAKVATVLGSIPASSDTVESEGRQI